MVTWVAQDLNMSADIRRGTDAAVGAAVHHVAFQGRYFGRADIQQGSVSDGTATVGAHAASLTPLHLVEKTHFLSVVSLKSVQPSLLEPLFGGKLALRNRVRWDKTKVSETPPRTETPPPFHPSHALRPPSQWKHVAGVPFQICATLKGTREKVL